MKTLAFVVTIIGFTGCVLSVAPVDSPPPPATGQHEVTPTQMFDTLNSALIWSPDEKYVFANGRSGLVRVEVATGAVTTVDARTFPGDGLILSGSGLYLYRFASPNFGFTAYDLTFSMAIRYRLSDLAVDTVASGINVSFIASPASDEIAVYNRSTTSLVLIDPTTGIRKSFVGYTPYTYSPDGTKLLVRRSDAYDTLSILHADGSISLLGRFGSSAMFPYFVERYIWTPDGIDVLYYRSSEMYNTRYYYVEETGTGTVTSIEGGGEFSVSPDNTCMSFWKFTVTKWVSYFFFEVPAEEDIIINLYTFSIRLQQSWKVLHTDKPSNVTMGRSTISPTHNWIAYIYNGSLKIFFVH